MQAETQEGSGGSWSAAVTGHTTERPQTIKDLHDAVLMFDTFGVVEQLDFGVPVDGADSYGQSPLMSASRKGYLPIVKELLTRDADVDYRDCGGRNALMVACEAGHANVVELLLNRNAQIDHDDMAGSTALHFAIDGDTPSIVEFLLKNGHDVGPRDFVAGWTPLMRAAVNGGSEDVAEVLIEHGTNVNLRDRQGLTALMLATIHDNSGMVKVLAPHSEQTLATSRGATAIEFGITFGSIETKRGLSIPDDQLNNL